MEYVSQRLQWVVAMLRQSVKGGAVLAAALLSTPAFALDPALLPSQYVLENWQIPDGLPQSSGQAVARTPDGYLWVGTQEGLARFDGVRFVTFDSANEPGLADKYISVLHVDHQGRLWIGTRTGLSVYEHGAFRRIDRVVALGGAYVRAIAEDTKGRL